MILILLLIHTIDKCKDELALFPFASTELSWCEVGPPCTTEPENFSPFQVMGRKETEQGN